GSKPGTRLIRLVLVAFALSPFVQAQEAGGWIQSDRWLFLGPLGNPRGCDPGEAVDGDWIYPEWISTALPSAGEEIDISFRGSPESEWLGASGTPRWECL